MRSLAGGAFGLIMIVATIRPPVLLDVAMFPTSLQTQVWPRKNWVSGHQKILKPCAEIYGTGRLRIPWAMGNYLRDGGYFITCIFDILLKNTGIYLIGYR